MLFEARGLTKRFGGLTAVSDVTFDIGEGEIVGIFGPNGSGKTTTLSLIAGMLAPTSGELLWNGQRIVGRRPFEIAGMGIIKTFQNPQLFPELTVLDHM
ncbi:MAG: ATP-binding cassette domain-containing protein, partial [Methylobacteriaceae bacterium]|nr:ATP-binding cassette domain-containing protein [Methylobacteriaceae bacterium]